MLFIIGEISTGSIIEPNEISPNSVRSLISLLANTELDAVIVDEVKRDFII